ncbi:hypothetical protein GE061_011235 [Apolygus lucorum]|uniref:Uncharacterized protein n=1 Tax=Apolygus lucorum TaxID=248454 RepID=A0A8S9Y0V6_APOLU|nr:hypothetical protein GE061_011235 [Apolygus lucorum]
MLDNFKHFVGCYDGFKLVDYFPIETLENSPALFKPSIHSWCARRCGFGCSPLPTIFVQEIDFSLQISVACHDRRGA